MGSVKALGVAGVNRFPALPFLVPREVRREDSLGVLVVKSEVKVEKEPEEPEEPEEIEYSPAELKKIERDKIVLEAAANRGATIPEICELLREKGHLASQRTVWTVLHSDKAVRFAEELERVQFRDIALLRAYALQDKEAPNLKALAAAIHARGLMIMNLKPRPELVNVEVNVNQQTIIKQQHVLLAEYAGVIEEAAALNGHISTVRVRESVDSNSSSPGNGKERPKSKASEIPSPA